MQRVKNSNSKGQKTLTKLQKKNLPSLKKEMGINVQEAYSTQNRWDHKKNSPAYNNQKYIKYAEQRKDIKICKGKCQAS